jgi:Spy/CpxP family protein refolding chaperone
MKPWLKRTLFGIAGTTLVLGGLAGCARHHGPMTDDTVAEVRTKVVERIGHKLELNDAQKQKLSVLADEVVAQRKALRGDGGHPREQFRALVAGERFDREKAQALLNEKTQVVQGAGPRVIGALADFYDSLNPEQQRQVRERLAERKGWWARG